MKTIRNIGLLLVVFVFQSSVFYAQGPSADNEKPSMDFSVVSIKPSNPNGGRGGQPLTDDGLAYKLISVMYLIDAAYGLPNQNFVIGAPGWVENDDYDIVAKVDDSEVATYSALKPEDKVALLSTCLEGPLQTCLPLGGPGVPRICARAWEGRHKSDQPASLSQRKQRVSVEDIGVLSVGCEGYTHAATLQHASIHGST
jgi:hypothetical protein